MKKTINIFGIAALLAVTACADMKNLPEGGKLKNEMISAKECDGDFVLTDARGVAHVNFIKDTSKDKLLVEAKAVMWKKPLDQAHANIPAVILGLAARSKEDRQFIAKDILGKDKDQLEDLGDSIPLMLGNVNARSLPSAATNLGSTNKLEDLRASIQLDTSDEDLAPAAPHIEIPATDLGGWYSTGRDPIELDDLNDIKDRRSSLEKKANGGQSVKAVSGGIANIASMALSLEPKKMAMVAFVPADPQPASLPEGAKKIDFSETGKPITIAVAPDPAPPEGATRQFVVQFRPPNIPTSGATQYTCVQTDNGQSSVTIPSEWKSGEKSGAIAAGSYNVVVARRYLNSVTVPDEAKGKFYIQTMSTFPLKASLKKPEKK